MILSEHTRITQNTRVAARTIDDKSVIVVLDERKVHALNELGSLIWNMADGRSLADIVEIVVQTYDVDRTIALGDVQKFVAELVSLKVLEVADA